MDKLDVVEYMTDRYNKDMLLENRMPFLPFGNNFLLRSNSPIRQFWSWITKAKRFFEFWKKEFPFSSRASFKVFFSILIFTSMSLVKNLKTKKPRRFRRTNEAYIDRELISQKWYITQIFWITNLLLIAFFPSLILCNASFPLFFCTMDISTTWHS